MGTLLLVGMDSNTKLQRSIFACLKRPFGKLLLPLFLSAEQRKTFYENASEDEGNDMLCWLFFTQCLFYKEPRDTEKQYHLVVPHSWTIPRVKGTLHLVLG